MFALDEKKGFIVNLDKLEDKLKNRIEELTKERDRLNILIETCQDSLNNVQSMKQ